MKKSKFLSLYPRQMERERGCLTPCGTSFAGILDLRPTTNTWS